MIKHHRRQRVDAEALGEVLGVSQLEGSDADKDTGVGDGDIDVSDTGFFDGFQSFLRVLEVRVLDADTQ